MTRRLFLAFAAAAAARAQQKQPDDPVLRAMVDELERSRALSIVSAERPYFIEYAVHDGESFGASATLGALVASNRVRYRLPRIQVRVGDFKFDNTNYVGTDFFSGARYDVDQFPLDDSYTALRHHLWLATDAAYKGAVEGFSRKRAALKNVAAPDDLPDFSEAEPVQLVLERRRRPIREDEWKARVRKLSSVFLQFPGVVRSTVDVDFGQSVQYIASSAGARVRVAEGMVAIRARAAGYAADGMPIRDAVIFHSLDPDALPSDAEMERGLRQVGENLAALAAAPLGETYSGPVLFEGIASAQIMAEVLGRNLGAPRRPVSNPGRPVPFTPSAFEGRIGSRVLPEWMDVIDDPAQTEWRGRALFGSFAVDLEGVQPKPLTVVEKGVLKNLLLTRQPVRGFSGSNGRARLPGAFGHKTAAPGNLFVKASETAPLTDLRARMLAMCRQRSKPYGIIVRKMDFPSSAGFDEIRRMLAGAAESGSRPVSLPVLVYRVHLDGREELVRGMRLRAFSPRSLRDIVRAADDTHVFDYLENGAPFAVMGGASFVSETSVLAPSVLIDDVELERVPQEFPRPPLVPPPPLT